MREHSKKNELRVCAARSRRRSSVGRTRFVCGWGYGDFTQDAVCPGPGSPVRRRGRSSTTSVSRSEVSLSVRSAASSGQRFGALVGVVTADLRGAAMHAVPRPDSGRGGRWGSWPHGLPARKPADEDQPPLVTVRTDHRLDRRHRLCVGRLRWRGGGVLQRIKLGWRLELQRLAHPCGVMALRGMPQTVVADLVEAAAARAGGSGA